MENLVIMNVRETESEVIFTVKTFLDGWFIREEELTVEQLATLVVEGASVEFDENDEEVETQLKYMTCKYASVEVDADESGEHDVYIHNAIVEDGKVTMNNVGEFVKSYKREKSAIKFAEGLADKVVVR